MHSSDRPTTDSTAYDDATLQTSLVPLPHSHPLPIREFISTDQPRHRLAHQGASALSDAELLALITGVPHLELAQRLLIEAGGLRGLQALSTTEMQQLVAGISAGRAAQLKAAIELGVRVARGGHLARKQIKSPTDVAELLVLEMSHLAQEHLRTVLLDQQDDTIAPPSDDGLVSASHEASEHEGSFTDTSVLNTEGTRVTDRSLSEALNDELTRQVQAEIRMRCGRQRGRVVDGL